MSITATFQTLPLALEGSSTGGPSYVKNITRVWLRVHQSSGVFVGPSLNELTEHKQRTDEPYGSPPRLTDGEIEIPIQGTWGRGGTLVIQQQAPLPLTVQSIAMEVAVGR